MIKIIEYGKKRRVKCICCGSILEYEESDIKSLQTGKNEWKKYIICPVCNHEVNVN